ncbi:MAG: cohesin domain-containing protein [Planctomycetes bacterium]|nr:cohesin domain-containing protein [Planctomycetota bacterium]
MKKIIIIIVFVLTFFSFLAGLAIETARAAGATLFFSPASGTYTVNKSFSVKVSVDSGGGIGINAAEGVIKYNPAYLNVASVSETGSIFSLWTANPNFSNNEGKVTFGGGSPTAYKGQAGSIFSVTFTPKKEGETEVSFLSGIVLAADGKGTNVYAGAGSAKYKIVAAAAAPPKTETPKEEVKGILPPLPEVSSPSHPDENVWYANNRPELSWKLLADLTGVSFLIDDQPGTVPDNKLMIDVTPPEKFTIVYDNENDPTNPVPKLRFSTKDTASGIDFYQVELNQEKIRVAPAEVGQGYYQLSPHTPGEYTARIAASDKAQNVSSSTIKFMIEPLKAPIITSVPKVIDRREELIIQGTSFYPQVTVKLFISKSEKETIEATVKTDDQGNWSYFHRGSLAKGNYEVWAKIIDNRGAESSNSARHLMSVVSPSLVAAYGFYIIIILLLIIVALIVYIFYQRKKFEEEKRRIKAETDEVKDKLRKVFVALREEVDELIEMSDKEPGLSEAERRIKEKLQESLDISEEFITKEVDDVEKEIK